MASSALLSIMISPLLSAAVWVSTTTSRSRSVPFLLKNSSSSMTVKTPMYSLTVSPLTLWTERRSVFPPLRQDEVCLTVEPSMTLVRIDEEGRYIVFCALQIHHQCLGLRKDLTTMEMSL